MYHVCDINHGEILIVIGGDGEYTFVFVCDHVCLNII